MLSLWLRSAHGVVTVARNVSFGVVDRRCVHDETTAGPAVALGEHVGSLESGLSDIESASFTLLLLLLPVSATHSYIGRVFASPAGHARNRAVLQPGRSNVLNRAARHLRMDGHVAGATPL